jgi:hypothetical protein
VLQTALLWIRSLVSEFRGHGFLALLRIVRNDCEDSSPSAQHHECFIHGDAYQPSGEQRLFLKAVEMEKGLVKALLHHIFRVLSVARNPLRHGKNSLLVTRDQLLESMSVTPLRGSYQCGVCIFAHIPCRKRFHDAPSLFVLRSHKAAIVLPEAIREESGVEVAGRTGNESTEERLGYVNRPLSLSKCWYQSAWLDGVNLLQSASAAAQNRHSSLSIL